MDIDTSAARASAARLEAIAVAVRARGRAIAAASTTGGWDGPAARAFRHRAQSVAGSLRLAAAHLDAAAEAQRRHALAVERALEHRVGAR